MSLAAIHSATARKKKNETRVRIGMTVFPRQRVLYIAHSELGDGWSGGYGRRTPRLVVLQEPIPLRPRHEVRHGLRHATRTER